jgi:hypothetical protein
MDDDKEEYNDYDGDWPPYAHPWREITTFTIVAILVIWGLIWVVTKIWAFIG